MNNKFIPILSFFMTISLVVFVSLQLYWIRDYYNALTVDFSNKVHEVLENTSQKVNKYEIQKYYNDYKSFTKTIQVNAKNPTQTYIQSITDKDGKRLISFSKNIIEKQEFPISTNGDSLQLTKLYTDEGLVKINNATLGSISQEMNQDFSNNNFSLKEFAKLNANNLELKNRIDPKTLDSLLKQELHIKGIDTKFGYAVLDKDMKTTSYVSDLYPKDLGSIPHNFPLFTDSKFKPQFHLSLYFPDQDFAMAKNNLPLVLGTIISLLTILGIYIVSIGYMSRQKKIAEIKTDFINNMSHEFKTPLATISVATESLNNEKINSEPEKVKYYSNLIKQENIRMKKQVENILNMSKLERNEMKLFLRKSNVRALIHQLSTSFRLIVEKRGGTLVENFNADVYEFPIDEFHISNALVNLLDNSNKYSPETPEITITTHNETHNENQFYVIEIEDKGIGMDPQNKQKVFEKFFREETGNIHNVKGQGLGLSYVKKIIELHKGQVLVETEKNKGSKFTVKLPIIK